jgi:alpha-ketoglutarate-dependent taurine dioxygenase
MKNELFEQGYYTTNQEMNSVSDWITFCEKYLTLRQRDLWTMHPESDMKVMILSTKKKDEEDFLASRSSLLGWHYDGIGMLNREHVVALYCRIPNAVTSIVNLHKMYQDMPKDIKQIVNNAVSELYFDEKIYDLSEKEKKLLDAETTQLKKELLKPLIQIHPISEKIGLLYHKNFVKKLYSISKPDYKKFLKYYNDHFEECRYDHVWKKHDILIMDQIFTIHSRAEFNGEREMWRSSGWYKNEIL